MKTSGIIKASGTSNERDEFEVRLMNMMKSGHIDSLYYKWNENFYKMSFDNNGNAVVGCPLVGFKDKDMI